MRGFQIWSHQSHYTDGECKYCFTIKYHRFACYKIVLHMKDSSVLNTKFISFGRNGDGCKYGYEVSYFKAYWDECGALISNRRFN